MREVSNYPDQSVSLAEALSRVLDIGVVVLGEATLSVADIDLVYVQLQLVVRTPEGSAPLGGAIRGTNSARPPREVNPGYGPMSAPLGGTRGAGEASPPSPALRSPAPGQFLAPPSLTAPPAPSRREQGLAKLVLVLLKLLHDLMEHQALRRVEGGSLSPANIEKLGDALMRQTQEIERLQMEFGLRPEDVNLDLGPLGKLF